MAAKETDEYCGWLRRQLRNLARSAMRASAPQRLMFAALMDCIRREFKLNCEDEPPGTEGSAA